MNKERLTTFVDAVLAIIMTILVLDLEKPSPVTLEGFWALRDSFFAYTLSFFWLGAMWSNLHNEWYSIKKITKKTVWATLLMLFCSSLFPYATSIMSNNFDNKVAQSFYGVVVLAITFANIITYRTLRAPNQENETIVTAMRNRGHWLKYDVIIKLLGLVMTIVVFPQSMSLSVLFTLLFLVIPQQFK